jgi:hypothetical protein
MIARITSLAVEPADLAPENETAVEPLRRGDSISEERTVWT